MKTMRIVIALAFAAALVACNQQAAKTETPAEGAATADAAQAADTGAKPGEAAPAGGEGAKPDAPSQAPTGAAPDKPD
jgi:hypothetical protein